MNMKPRKDFIFIILAVMICLLYLTFINLTLMVNAETIETTEATVTTSTKINNFDIKDLSEYIDSKDYVVCYVYKGQYKGNYIIYPYDDLFTFNNNNYNPFYTQNGFYRYDPKTQSFGWYSIVFGGYDWRNYDTYIIGSTYDIRNENTGDIVFFKTLSNDNIMFVDITSGTIYNNFFSIFKPVIVIVLVSLIAIFAFYKCWGWLRDTLQGI